MPLRIASNVIPRVELSDDERQEFADEAAAVVAEAARIEAALRADGYRIPTKHWKPVRQHEGFTVYQERGVPPAMSKAGSGSSRSNSTLLTVASTSDVELSLQSESEDDEASFHHRSRHRACSTATSIKSTYSTDSNSNCRINGRMVKSKSMGGERAGWAEMATDPASLVVQMKEPHNPMLLATGEHDGTVEDSVFGCLAADPVNRKLRTSVIKDKVADAKLVATIHGPTPEDPCRFLGVKWLIRDLPPVLDSFIHPRDHLILEASGYVDDADGGYGYHLLHSIDLPELPELTSINVVRSKLSMCFIARRTATPGRVRLFAWGFSNPRGQLSIRAATRLTAEAMIAATRAPECAQIKKLQWLMHHRHRASPSPRATAPSRGGARRRCGCCQTEPPRDLKVVLGLSSALHACEVCGDAVCGRCTLVKGTMVPGSRPNEVISRTLRACMSCSLRAKGLSAFDVARATTFKGPEPAKLKGKTNDDDGRC